MTRNKQDIPGNTVASALAVQRHLVGTGERVALFEKTLDGLFEDGIDVVGLSVKMPHQENPDYLWVVRAVAGDERKVAFHAGETFEESLRGLLSRLANRSLKWRRDEHA